MLKLRYNTLDEEYRTTIPNACILSAFLILSYQKKKIACETSFLCEKKNITRKVSCFFERVRQLSTKK